MGRNEIDLIELFNNLDKDGDGKISYNEFLVGALDKTKLLNEENLRIAFDVLDTDGDGTVTADEMRNRFAQSNLGGMNDLNVTDEFWQKWFNDF